MSAASGNATVRVDRALDQPMTTAECSCSKWRHATRRPTILWRLSLLCLLLAACTSLLPRIEPPRITLTSMRVVATGGDEVRLGLVLAVENPNLRDVRLDALDLRLGVSATAVGTAVLDAPVLLTAQQITPVRITATTSSAAWAQALNTIGRTLTVAYEIKGTATLEGRRVPLAHNGERNVLELLSRPR